MAAKKSQSVAATPTVATPAQVSPPQIQAGLVARGASPDIFEKEVMALEKQEQEEESKAVKGDEEAADKASLLQADSPEQDELEDKDEADAETDETEEAEPEAEEETEPSEELEDEEQAEHSDEVEDQELSSQSEFFEKVLSKHKVDPKFIRRTRKVYEENQSLKEKLAAAEDAKNAALAEVVKPLPSGALASIDSMDMLDKWQDWALQVTSANPDDVERHYRDNNTHTAEEQYENDLQQAKFILRHYKEQAKIIQDRNKTRSEIAKQYPELFDSRSQEYKLFRELNESDPRLRPDWDRIVALAVQADKREKEEKSGKVKYTRIDLKKARSTSEKPVKKAFKPILTPEPKTPVKPVAAKKSDSAALEQRYLKTGKEEDYRAWLVSMES